MFPDSGGSAMDLVTVRIDVDMVLPNDGRARDRQYRRTFWIDLPVGTVVRGVTFHEARPSGATAILPLAHTYRIGE